MLAVYIVLTMITTSIEGAGEQCGFRRVYGSVYRDGTLVLHFSVLTSKESIVKLCLLAKSRIAFILFEDTLNTNTSLLIKSMETSIAKNHLFEIKCSAVVVS